MREREREKETENKERKKESERERKILCRASSFSATSPRVAMHMDHDQLEKNKLCAISFSLAIDSACHKHYAPRFGALANVPMAKSELLPASLQLLTGLQNKC